MTYCYKIGYEFKTYMQGINDYIISQTNTNDTIIIKNINLSGYPFVYNIKKWELSNNPDADINKEWSFYYSLKSIRAE